MKLKKNRDDDDNDDAHPCSSLLHCGIIKAFLGCLGFLDPHDDPLLPTHSPDATQDEDYGVITTTVQTLSLLLPLFVFLLYIYVICFRGI